MNWRRGLFRVWIVFSLVWAIWGADESNIEIHFQTFMAGPTKLPPIVAAFDNASKICIEQGGDWQKNPYDQYVNGPNPWAKPIPQACIDAGRLHAEKERYEESGRRIMFGLWLIVSAPLMTFLFAVILLWVARGFRNQPA